MPIIDDSTQLLTSNLNTLIVSSSTAITYVSSNQWVNEVINTSNYILISSNQIINKINTDITNSSNYISSKFLPLVGGTMTGAITNNSSTASTFNKININHPSTGRTTLIPYTDNKIYLRAPVIIDFDTLILGSRILDFLIYLWGNEYGFGINANVLRYNCATTASHKFYSGSINTATISNVGRITATAFTGDGNAITNLNYNNIPNRLTFLSPLSSNATNEINIDLSAYSLTSTINNQIANTSNYILEVQGILVNNIDTVSTSSSNFTIGTSNILVNKINTDITAVNTNINNQIANTSNYILGVQGILQNNIDIVSSSSSNFTTGTSNILVNKINTDISAINTNINNQIANTSNYISTKFLPLTGGVMSGQITGVSTISATTGIFGQVATTNNTNIGAPNFGVYGGNGDRLILKEGTVSTYPVSFGFSGLDLWYSVPTAVSHRFYVNGSLISSIFSAGLSTTGYINASTNLRENGVNLSSKYLQLSGGSMTGNLSSTGTINASTNLQENGVNLTSKYLQLSGGSMTGQITGVTTLNGTTGIFGTLQTTNNTNVAVPSVGIAGGIGDKLILYSGSVSTYPYSFGINTNELWYSTPTGASHKFYVNGSAITTISSTGLSTTGTINASTNLQENGTNLTSKYLQLSGGSMTGQITGVTTLNGTTGIFGKLQTTNNTNVAAPSLGVAGGIGDKIILYPGSVSTYPYSFGINTNELWYSTPSGASHKFYNNGTNILTLNSSGDITTPGSINITSANQFLTFGQRLQDNLIKLWTDGNFTFGLGINSSVLRYNVPAGSSHIFYTGTNNTLQINPDGHLISPGYIYAGGTTSGLRINGNDYGNTIYQNATTIGGQPANIGFTLRDANSFNFQSLSTAGAYTTIARFNTTNGLSLFGNMTGGNNVCKRSIFTFTPTGVIIGAFGFRYAQDIQLTNYISTLTGPIGNMYIFRIHIWTTSGDFGDSSANVENMTYLVYLADFGGNPKIRIHTIVNNSNGSLIAVQSSTSIYYNGWNGAGGASQKYCVIENISGY